MNDVLRQLEIDARRLRMARKLPAGTLPPDLAYEVLDDFHAYLQEHQISLAQVAHELGPGFSAGQLSTSRLAREGKFGGDLEKLVRGLNSWMEQHALRHEIPAPSGFVETFIARRMLTMILNVSRLSTIGVIYGPSGVGKSMVLQAAHAKYAGSMLIRIRRSTRTATGLARQIGAALRIEGAKTLFDLQETITRRLRGSGRMLLVDEAHQLQIDALELIRDIHDEAEIPVVLCGTKTLCEKVTDTREWFGQFNSRSGLRYDVTDDLKNEGRGKSRPKTLTTVEEIIKMFASDQVKLTADGAHYLLKLANVPGLGCFRLCRQIVRVAMAAKPGCDLTAALLRRVYIEMQSTELVDAFEDRALETAVA